MQCPHPFKKNLMFGRDADQKDRKPDASQAPNQLKHALVSITDDLLNFDLAESHAQNNGSTDDTSNVGGDTAQCQNDGGRSFVWTCNVFRARGISKVVGAITPVSRWAQEHRHLSVVVGWQKECLPTVWSSRKNSSGGFKFGDSRVFPIVRRIITPCTAKIGKAGVSPHCRLAYLVTWLTWTFMFFLLVIRLANGRFAFF